jgi:hypothetical protein
MSKDSDICLVLSLFENNTTEFEISVCDEPFRFNAQTTLQNVKDYNLCEANLIDVCEKLLSTKMCLVPDKYMIRAEKKIERVIQTLKETENQLKFDDIHNQLCDLNVRLVQAGI